MIEVKIRFFISLVVSPKPSKFKWTCVQFFIYNVSNRYYGTSSNNIINIRIILVKIFKLKIWSPSIHYANSIMSK